MIATRAAHDRPSIGVRTRYRGGDARAWLFTVMHNVRVSNIRRISAQPRAVNAYSSAEDSSWRGRQIGWIGEIREALSLTILLTALLWVLISIPVAIAVGTVISFGQSGRPRFHPARHPGGRRALPVPRSYGFNKE